MSKKTLAVTLSKLKSFVNPKISLEQYQTDSDIAATILWEADMQGLVKDKIITDLGAGTGVLGIGCLLLGAKKVYFVEKDKDAIVTLTQNIAQMEDLYELGEYEIICKDVSHFEIKSELVITNPPFGTQIKGSDIKFLEIAMFLSDKVISFHKTETADYINKFIKNNGFSVEETMCVAFPLKNTMKQHKKRLERIDVTIWIISKKNS